MIILMFITALALSAVAAYYSIAGLVAIFASAVIPIILMGSTLEVAKEVPVMLKTYFMTALVVLMLLTSMGIFGYLSKAHLDQAIPSGDIAAKVSLIDEKINQEKENINAARKTLIQLDSQVDQTIARTSNDTTDKGVGRSVSIRKSQARERKELYKTIQASQSEISKLNEERAPISKELRKVEAEVGPIKYIAALIYGDNLDESFLEKAVRIVILMIVSVFDPLAVLMLVAANWSLKNSRKEDLVFDTTGWKWDGVSEDFNPRPEPAGWQQVWQPTSEAWPPYEPDFPDVEEIRKQTDVDQNMEMTEHLFGTEDEFFAHGKEVAKELDVAEGQLPADYASTQSYLEDPMSWTKFTGTEGFVPKLETQTEWDPSFLKIFEGDDIIPSPKPPPKSTISVNEIDYDPINKMTFKHK